MRYHGNYCGPDWSAGKHQPSVVSDVPAVDDFDLTCKKHDAAYATEGNLREADLAFAAENLLTLNPKRWLAGALVGVQGLSRPFDRTTKPITKMNSNSTRSARTAAVRMPKTRPPNMRSNNVGKVSNTTRLGNDVVTAVPLAVSTRRSGRKPAVTTRDGITTITHREFLGPINNTSAYTVSSFAANPGLATSFPWLSSLASRFDKYRFINLGYEFRSVTSASKAGVALMSFDYNARDAAPLSKDVQAQTIPNTENNIWMNNTLQVPTDNQWRFVRQGSITNTDIKTYDLGNMHLSTVYGDGVVGGELYITYTVQLDKPSEPGNIAQLDIYVPAAVGQPLANDNIFAVAAAFTTISNTLLRCDVGGIYLLFHRATGTTITALNTPTLAGTGTVQLLDVTTINTAATSATNLFKVTISKDSTLDFSAITAAATLTGYRIYITQYFT